MIPAATSSAPVLTPQLLSTRTPIVAAITTASSEMPVVVSATLRRLDASSAAVLRANGAITAFGPSVRKKNVKILPSPSESVSAPWAAAARPQNRQATTAMADRRMNDPGAPRQVSVDFEA